ncbi:MAG: DUF6884 domain-containing protein [Tepidisphaeraceae bacterium]
MATRIALVSRVKQKRGSPSPACDLYPSPLFRGLRRYAETHSDAWYILSAEYGVLYPDQIVAPYERTLNKMSKSDRLIWADGVQKQLLELLPPGAEVILLAGLRYRQDIEPFLRARGFSVTVPLKGMKIGEQLHRLKGAAS